MRPIPRVYTHAVALLIVVAALTATTVAQRRYAYGSSARLQVTPSETEIYVDGYLVGTADDFDGFAQRLRLDAGEHILEFYLRGHRLATQTLFFQPGETYRIGHRMEPLTSGEAEPSRPSPATSQPATPLPPYGSPAGRTPRDSRDRNEREPPPPGSRENQATNAGSIVVRVQPGDALVLIDGERWQSSSNDAPLSIQVNPGAHRVEVQKEGYQPFSTTVHVRAGQANTLNISLTPRSATAAVTSRGR